MSLFFLSKETHGGNKISYIGRGKGLVFGDVLSHSIFLMDKKIDVDEEYAL
jgi:hypothetical protein